MSAEYELAAIRDAPTSCAYRERLNARPDRELGQLTTSTPGRILILSGLPGIGKSEIADSLQAEGWLRLSVDEEAKAPPGLRAAWSSALNGNDTR